MPMVIALETAMNSTVVTQNRASPQAARPVSPMLYPTLLIAGISVIIASLLGIAAMTGLLPQAQSQPAVTTAATGKAVAEPGPHAWRRKQRHPPNRRRRELLLPKP